MKTKSFLARSLNHRAKDRATVSEASVFEPEPEPKSQNFELQSQSQNKYFNLCQKSKPFKEHLFSLITSETRQRGVIRFLEALPCNRAKKPSKSHRLNLVPELIPSILKSFLFPFDYPNFEPKNVFSVSLKVLISKIHVYIRVFLLSFDYLPGKECSICFLEKCQKPEEKQQLFSSLCRDYFSSDYAQTLVEKEFQDAN